MGTLYERIIALCQDRGITGGRLCTDLGMSKGTLTDLKMGRQTGISAAKAQKIASYFGVSVGYLLGDEENEKPTAQGDGLSETHIKLLELTKSLSVEEAEALLVVLQAKQKQ